MLDCNRFKKYGKSNSITEVESVVFLNLRENGTNRLDAIKYCTKPTCRSDSTQIKDGPSNNRSLKLVHDKTITQNGWHFLGKNYYLGPHKFTSSKQILKKEKKDKSLEKNFQIQEENVKNDFKKKIKNLNEYFQVINKKFSLKSKNNSDLKEKIHNLQFYADKKFSSKVYVELGETKIFELANEKFHQKNFSNDSLITKLDIFPEMVKKSKIKFVKPPFQKRMSSPLIFKKKIPTFKSFDTENFNLKQVGPQIILEKFNSNAESYEILQKQNEYLKEISEVTFLAGEISKGNVRKSRFKKGRASTTYKPPDSLPSKDSIAREFNEANYIFFKENDEKKYNTNYLKSLIKKEKQRLKGNVCAKYQQQTKERLAHFEKLLIDQEKRNSENDKMLKNIIQYSVEEKRNNNSGYIDSSNISRLYSIQKLVNSRIQSKMKISPFNNTDWTDNDSISESLGSPVNESKEKKRGSKSSVLSKKKSLKKLNAFTTMNPKLSPDSWKRQTNRSTHFFGNSFTKFQTTR